MSWPVPKYTKGDINKAGAILAEQTALESDLAWALDVLNNWRACHGYPINTFQATLRDKLERFRMEGIVAQRLKRTPSIIGKLRRFDQMQLARMQDIGGLRAVVASIADVRELQASYKQSRFKHILASEKDYIANPKDDGYRSVHLVFRYVSNLAPKYNGLSIELQVRTRLQHVWATAVETMGTFLGQALKSHQGDKQWIDFFKITGSAFAYIEKCPLVPGFGHLSKQETFEQVLKAERNLGVLSKLRGFSLATRSITADKGQGSYHLVTLDSRNKTVHISAYSIGNLSQAIKDYAEVEARAKNGEPIESVLVSAGPVTLLRKAFPNYFLDTDDFVKRVEFIIRSVSPRKPATTN